MGNSHSIERLQSEGDIVLDVVSGKGKEPSTFTNLATGEVLYTTVLEKFPGLLKSRHLHLNGGSHGQLDTPYATLYGSNTIGFHMDVGQAAAEMQQRNFLFRRGSIMTGRNYFIARNETWRFQRAGKSILLFAPSDVTPSAVFTYSAACLTHRSVQRTIRILESGIVGSGTDKKSRYALFEHGRPTAYLDIAIIAEILWRRWDARAEGGDGMGGETLQVAPAVAVAVN